MTASVSVRGDIDRFNLAKFLWGHKVRRESGKDLKDFWGPDSFEWQWYSKAQGKESGQDGGFLAPEEWRLQFVDIIRDYSALRVGTDIQYITTNSKAVHIPVAMSEMSFAYQSENVNLGASSFTTRKFAQRTATLRKGIAIQQFATELFRDAGDLANQLVSRSIAEAIAFEQDQKTLIGNGQGGTPIGILNATNVTVTNKNGTPTTGDLAAGVANAMNLNGSTNVPVGSTTNIRVVTAPRIVLTIGSIAAAGALPWQFGQGPQASVNYLGVPWILTNSVPINAGSGSQSHAFFGDWRHCLVVQSSAIAFDLDTPMGNSSATDGGLTTIPLRTSGLNSVVATRSPDFQTDQIDVKAVIRYDVILLHPEAFFVLQNISQ